MSFAVVISIRVSSVQIFVGNLNGAAESGSAEGAEKRPADKIPVGRNRVYSA